MANRSDRDSKSMRRQDRRLLSGGITRSYINPGEDAANARKLMMEASLHAKNVRNKRSTLLTNVDKSTEEDAVG